jgi:hypothetical protein
VDAVLRELENELLDVVDAIEEGAIAARGRQRLIEVSACTRTRCTSLPSQPCSVLIKLRKCARIASSYW